MNQADLRFIRRVLVAALIALCLIGLYITTPPECFGDGPVPLYCVEG